MDITLTTFFAGLVASALTEVFKFWPTLRESRLWTSVVAIILVALAAFVSNHMVFSLDNVLVVLVFAFVNYKMFVSPIAESAGLSTQK